MTSFRHILLASVILGAVSTAQASAQDTIELYIHFQDVEIFTEDAVGVFTGKPTDLEVTSCDNLSDRVVMNLLVLRQGMKPVSVDVIVFVEENVGFGDRISNVQVAGFDQCTTTAGLYLIYSADIE